MLVHLRKLSLQTMTYGMGDAATSLIALILLPVYTHILTPGDFGRLAIITVVSTVITIILDSGQRSSFFRLCFQNEAAYARRRLTGTVVIYLLVSAAVILSPLLLFLDHLAFSLVRDSTLLPLIRIALIGTFFDVGSMIPFATFRAEQRAAPYATLSVIRFLISATLNIIAVVVLRWGVAGVIYANLVTSILFFVICFGLTLHRIEWTVDFNLLKKALYFGLPLVPANIAGWVLALSDRFFLERFANLGQVGIYSVGCSIAGVLNIMMGWFNNAWAPYCFSIAKQPNSKDVYARILTYATTLFTIVGFGLSLFAREVLSLLTAPSYYGAASVVPLIVLAYLFFEVGYLIGFGFYLADKTTHYPLILITGAVSNLFLNFMLIPPFGMMGAAIATVLSYASVPIFGYVVVHRLYAVPYEWRRLSKLAIVSVAIYWIGTFLKTGVIAIDIGVGLALMLGWGFGLCRWKFFTQTEVLTAQAATGKLLAVFKVSLKRVVSIVCTWVR